MIKDYDCVLKMDSYIADPYWPEVGQTIDIQKISGMNRCRSEENRNKALATYLKSIDMTMEQYEALLVKAKKPWYRVDDGDQESEIVIPRHQFSGCLVEACKSAPAGSKFKQDELRARVQLSDFKTGKAEKDRDFARFIPNEATNQRRYHEDEVIGDFEASGTLRFDDDMTKPETVEKLIEHALFAIGVGAARKMGYGRGRLVGLG